MSLPPFFHHRLLPVFSVRPRPDPVPEGAVTCVDILGTAFSIGGDFLLTAGHVVRALGGPSHGGVRVVDRPNDEPILLRVLECEPLLHDLGIVRLHVPNEARAWIHPMCWTRDELEPLDRIRMVGFPHGMHEVDGERFSITRAFEGHVVSVLHRFLPRGVDPPSFRAYELSFMVPPGASGAPLLDARDVEEGMPVAGVVIGSQNVSVPVHSSTEVERSTRETTVVERYDRMSLGIAVHADVVFSTTSQLLGRTIGEHLEGHDLVQGLTP